MDINHLQSGSKGRFFMDEGKDVKAEVTYTIANTNLIIIDHTDVSDELRGKGVGVKLLDSEVGYFKSHDIKIIPLCPFAKSDFIKNHEFNDVIK